MAPQTGYELTGAWTTLDEEAAFLSTVSAETDATLTTAGRTVQDRPIYRVDLGAGVDQTMLIVSLQHGNEQASREAALMQLRDLAYSTDPATVAYLQTHRIVWLTNVNADAFPNRRLNLNNVNPNRDYYKLTQPETRVVTEVIRDTAPHMIVDAHEYFSTGEDWQGFPGGLPSTHVDIAALEQDCFDDAIATLTGMGYSAAYYPRVYMPKAGLSTAAGAHHAVGMLSETKASDTPELRVTVQRIILDMFRDWHEANAEACTAASIASREWASTTTDAYPLLLGEYIGQEEAQPIYLKGYQLASNLPALYVDTFGIQVGAGGFVPINQPARAVIPMLLEPQSLEVVASAVRVSAPPPPQPLPPGDLKRIRYRTGGVTYEVRRIRHQVAGTPKEVVTPTP